MRAFGGGEHAEVAHAVHHALSFRGGWLEGRAVAHQLKADQQPAPAHVADEVAPRGQLAQALLEVRADGFLYILQEYPEGDVMSKVEEAVPRCPTQAISIVEA